MQFKKLLDTGNARISPVYINESYDPHKSSSTYTNIKINNIQVKAIVDSGAEVTIIALSLVKRLKLAVTKTENNTRYVAANNEVLTHTGFTIIDIKIGQWRTKQKAIVVEKLSTELLLGTDWLRQHGVIINYQKEILSCGRFSTKLYTAKIQTNHSIFTNKSITIAALSSHIEWIDVPENFNGTNYFENENSIQHIQIRDGLFEIQQNSLPIVMINKNKFEVTIGKGKHLGTLEKCDHSQILNIKTSNMEKAPTASKLVNIDKNLNTDETRRIKTLADRYDQVFSKSENDIGFNDKAKFEIETGVHSPIKSRPYRVPYSQQDTVNKMIDDMLTHKIISKSNSPWASPVVIIKKKDGSNRFCVDYRKLNAITVKDNYPIPLIEETLDTLKGAKYFTSLDLASGYWQIALHETAKQKTAFITHKGLYQFEVLPFGLSNAVSAFQRTMEVILEGVENVKVYLDDILIFSDTFEDHLKHLEAVFRKLSEANLKIKPSKCQFAKQKTKFLGFDITSE